MATSKESIQQRAGRLADPRTEADYREAAELTFLHGGWVGLTKLLDRAEARYTYAPQARLAIMEAARDLRTALQQGDVISHEQVRARADPEFQRFLGHLQRTRPGAR